MIVPVIDMNYKLSLDRKLLVFNEDLNVLKQWQGSYRDWQKVSVFWRSDLCSVHDF